MNAEYELDYDTAKKSAELAKRIAQNCGTDFEAADLSSLLGEVEKLIEEIKPGPPQMAWTRWLAAARCYVAQDKLHNVMRNGIGVADAKAQLDLLQKEYNDLYGNLSNSLLANPLPTLYWARSHRWDRFREAAEIEPVASNDELDNAIPRVLRLIAFIDDYPLVSPQQLRPGTLYAIRLESYLANWTERIKDIEFRFVTTLSSSQYSLSAIVVAAPKKHSDDGTYVLAASAQLAFPFAQNDPFQPVVFSVSAAIRVDENRRPVHIIGHDQLSFQIRDDANSLLSSGWPRMDAHLHGLLQQLCSEQPTIKDELATLIPLMNALTAFLATVAQGGLLKGCTNMSEADFQVEALKLLRMKLGNDVQEGPKQAGGITDIRYRGAIVELKVESVIADREALAAKYSSQVTQYQGVEARSVAVLLILDLTQKNEPPGDLRNDIILRHVKTHAGTGPHRSWVFQFVVRGNTASPSDYSR